MFTQDHVHDFDAVLHATEPFALVRFGDGEAKVLAGAAYRSADAWSTPAGHCWIAPALAASLTDQREGYCIGLPPQCCMAVFATLANQSTTPRHRLTFATLFLHANLARASELLVRFAGACVVGSSFGDLRIPADGVTVPWDLEGLVTQMLAIDRPILLAAGPCANVIAHRYWQRQTPERRVTILDVGSALDVVHGARTRHYHQPGSPLLAHRCRWMLSGSPAAPGAGAQQPMVATRIRVGRSTVRSTSNTEAPAALATGIVQPRSGSVKVTTGTSRAGGCSSCGGRVRK
jgi:hypothetical protein